MGFTYHKAQDEIYYEPNLCRSEAYESEGSYAYSSNSGRVLTPTSRHKFPPILEE
jgi:hypothetical protein